MPKALKASDEAYSRIAELAARQGFHLTDALDRLVLSSDRVISDAEVEGRAQLAHNERDASATSKNASDELRALFSELGQNIKDTVKNEVRAALEAERQHLGNTDDDQATDGPPSPAGEALPASKADNEKHADKGLLTWHLFGN